MPPSGGGQKGPALKWQIFLCIFVCVCVFFRLIGVFKFVQDVDHCPRYSGQFGAGVDYFKRRFFFKKGKFQIGPRDEGEMVI